MSSEMKISALVPWKGSNRMLGAHVGKALAGCTWIGVPFAGSMAEVAHMKARTIVVNDIHRHVMNLARVVSVKEYRAQMVEFLQAEPFHPDVLDEAQRYCLNMETIPAHLTVLGGGVSIPWALNYFIASWMNRSSLAGTKNEFKGQLPIRWTSSGGDSNTRYRSAVESLEAWGAVMRRCNFSTLDALEFLGKCKDEKGVGIYTDPPFPGPGDDYKHTIDEPYQRRLAGRLSEFRTAKVVCRFYDHPLIRELYHEPHWTWNFLEGGKTQANKETNDAPEVLLCNRP